MTPNWKPAHDYPDADIEVYVYTSDDNNYLATWDDDLGTWRDTYTCQEVRNVTHWMELPEQPNNEAKQEAYIVFKETSEDQFGMTLEFNPSVSGDSKSVVANMAAKALGALANQLS